MYSKGVRNIDEQGNLGVLLHSYLKLTALVDKGSIQHA